METAQEHKSAERQGGGGEPRNAGGPGTVVHGVRLVVRVLLHAVPGGLALIAIATVASVLGPVVALDLATPATAAWWTVFTAVVVQGVPFLLLGTLVSAAVGVREAVTLSR